MVQDTIQGSGDFTGFRIIYRVQDTIQGSGYFTGSGYFKGFRIL